MQALTQKLFEIDPPFGIFNMTSVCNLFPNHSKGARKVLVHRAVNAGEVLRIKRGLYCLAKPYARVHPHPFVLAGMLLWPCHVSLETALWHHGLILEAVTSTACVTGERSHDYDTPLGYFSFRRVPSRESMAGVRAIPFDGGAWAYVAEPFRAICDFVYLRKDLMWKQGGLAFLTESLRIDEDALSKLAGGAEDADDAAFGVTDSRTVEYMTKLMESLKT